MIGSHTKFGPDRFRRFNDYWIKKQTNIDRLANCIYKYFIGQKTKSLLNFLFNIDILVYKTFK